MASGARRCGALRGSGGPTTFAASRDVAASTNSRKSIGRSANKEQMKKELAGISLSDSLLTYVRMPYRFPLLLSFGPPSPARPFSFAPAYPPTPFCPRTASAHPRPPTPPGTTRGRSKGGPSAYGTKCVRTSVRTYVQYVRTYTRTRIRYCPYVVAGLSVCGCFSFP